jgi:hypothetical protein
MARPSRPRRPINPKRHAPNNAIAETTCQPKREGCAVPAISESKTNCLSDARGANDLCGRYLAKLDADETPQWRELWELLITHPWFDTRLEQCTRTALRTSRLPCQLEGDIKHEVILRFVTKIRRRPDLGIDRIRVENHFAGWMHTVLMCECRMAIRTLRRLHYRTLPLLVDNAGRDLCESLDARMDLQAAISQLAADDSQILQL